MAEHLHAERPQAGRGTPTRRALLAGPQVLLAAVGAVERDARRLAHADRPAGLVAAQELLVGAGHPGRRSDSSSLAVGQEGGDHVGDVVVEAGAGDLVGPQLAAEVGLQPGGAAEVHLVALDLVAVASSTSWPLRPMSATWVRAQALGQPLTLTVIGASRSGKRRSSSATRSPARFLVSTMASLQNSMPVQAIVLRRQFDGRAESPIASRRSTRRSTRSASTPSTTIFWYGVSRAPATPYSSIEVGELGQHRAGRPGPTVGATPT